MRNIPTIDQLRQMPIGEIAELPADTLAVFVEDAKGQLEEAKKLSDWLNAALAIKYSNCVSEVGTHHVQQDGIDVAVTVAKNVKWDQDQLQKIHDDLIANGHDPKEYMRAKLDVSEAAFNAWPNQIREVFEPARTVEPRKATYKFKRVGAA